MRREAGELRWRVKLVVALAAAGGWLGAWAWAAWLAHDSGGWEGWTLASWLAWAWALIQRGFGVELALAALAGAVLFAVSALYFMFRSGSSARPALY